VLFIPFRELTPGWPPRGWTRHLFWTVTDAAMGHDRAMGYLPIPEGVGPASSPAAHECLPPVSQLTRPDYGGVGAIWLCDDCGVVWGVTIRPVMVLDFVPMSLPQWRKAVLNSHGEYSASRSITVWTIVGWLVIALTVIGIASSVIEALVKRTQ
jgi:hypothetical protein